MSHLLRLRVLVGLAVGSLGVTSVVQADPVYVGQSIRLYDGIGNLPGGEFNVDLNADGGIDFITFCVQY
jgi:hypothetical protein